MQKQEIQNENNKLSEKKNLLEKVNLVFSLFVVCLPLIISLFHAIGLTFINWDFLLTIFFILWLIYFSAYFIKNFNKIDFKIFIKNPIYILLIVLFLWMILSTIVTNSFNYIFIVYLSYLTILINFYMLDNGYRLTLLNTLISVLTLCCIMGFIDPSGEFMPGFDTVYYKFSLQFHNPNHIGYVIVIIEVLICGLFLNIRDIKHRTFYAITFTIIGFYIFLNGSFSPITAIFLGLFIYFIYYWIKNKKFPLEIFFSILLLALISALVDSIPFLKTARFTDYGYFTECFAVFDNIFGTNFLDWLGVVKVPGADGWNRGDLLLQSFVYIGESAFFGKGCGFSQEFRPHNEFAYISLDFGIPAGLIYVAMLVLLIIYTFKSKNKNEFSIPLIVSIISYYFSGLFGNITSHSFIYLMIIVGLCLKNIDEKEIKTNR